MKSVLPAIAAICAAVMVSCSPDRDAGVPADPHPVVVMQTTLGTMEITLDAEKAPRTVKNFLAYADAGFYDNTVFHRAAPGIMIQGGGYTAANVEKKTGKPIKSEAENGLRNRRGSIAMARDEKIHSATSQFFINLKDNPDFDHRDTTKKGFGYAVFGEVTAGMDVADKIAETLTDPGSGRIRVSIYSVKRK
jgi:cyclophilin family peptidyl-prolyl cis-trans isomerase